MSPGRPANPGRWRPWEAAWQDALYGPSGFYRRPEGPAGHFRTAAHASASGQLGAALARLARLTGCTSVVDVGAGHGELLSAVAAADPDLELLAVDLRPRPPGLAETVGWSSSTPSHLRGTLLVAWELLDVVPCPVLEVDGSGVARVVEVDAGGAERLGAAAQPADVAWCARWWPLEHLGPGDRVEVGRPRDAAWSSLVARVDEGLALAVDYGHLAGSRPTTGTLTGYRRGRQVPPVPDGSCDVTAHVALDAVAASVGGRLATQHEALSRLGVSTARQGSTAADQDPMGWLTALAAASEAGELLDPAGLGGFGWVLHARGALAGEHLAEWTSGAPA